VNAVGSPVPAAPPPVIGPAGGSSRGWSRPAGLARLISFGVGGFGLGRPAGDRFPDRAGPRGPACRRGFKVPASPITDPPARFFALGSAAEERLPSWLRARRRGAAVRAHRAAGHARTTGLASVGFRAGVAPLKTGSPFRPRP
jgi:hypothetical protein